MRTELERRPLVLALGGLVIGLSAPVFLANVLFVVVGLVFLRGISARVGLAMGFCVGAFLAPIQPQMAVGTTPVASVFTVVSVPSKLADGGSTFLADSPDIRVEVTSKGLMPVLGDEVSVQGEVRPLPQERERTYLARGVSGIVTGSSTVVTLVRRATGVVSWGEAWRESFIDYSRRHLEPGDSAVATALAFDVRTDLSREDRTALEQSGTVHVLAASGLHLLALAWVLELIGSKLFVPLLVRRTFIVCLVTVYSAATGFHPGTFRALVSTALRDGAIGIGREYDGLSGIAVAGILYLLWRPNMVYDAGFQLSMIIGAGIALFRSRSVGMAPLPRALRGSLVAWFVSIPVVAHLFGIVSIVSIPANVLAAGLLPVCLLGLLASHVASFVSSAAAEVLLVPATLAAHGLEAIVRGFGLARWWGFTVPVFSGYWLAAVYGAGLALWRPKARPVS